MQITTYYTPYIALLVILFFLTAAACNKDDDTSPADQLPPITMEGKGTFACLINGEVWKWKGRNPWNGFPNLDTSYWDPLNIFLIKAAKEINVAGEIKIQSMTLSSNPDTIGIYTLQFNQGIFVDYSQINVDCKAYELDTLQTHKLEILKLDKVNRIVSGTFEFTAFNQCDTLIVTNGRFDDFYHE